MWFQKPPLGTQLDWSNPLNKGLVLHLAMNEGHGDKVQDLSMNGNHGTLNGFAYPPTAASGWNPGETGVGLKFDGVDDCITPPQILYGSNFTIGFLARPKDLTNYQMIFDDSTNTHGKGGISLINNKWGVREKNADGGAVFTSTQLELNKWQCVVFVYENTTVKVYYNGALDNTLTPFAHIIQCDKIGYGAEIVDVGYRGMLDQPRIHNRAWTTKEVKDYAINPWQVYLDEDD